MPGRVGYNARAMRLGFLTLIKSSNKRKLIELALAYAEPGFMHYPGYAMPPPWVVVEPAAPCLEAAVRVTAAYRLALREYEPPAAGMWDDIEAHPDNRLFLNALRQGDSPAVAEALSGMFRTNLVYGLGRVHESLAGDNPEGIRQCRLRWVDLLVSLAEAVGAARVRLLLQEGVEAHRRALGVDAEALVRETGRRIGFDLSFPPVGGPYGCVVGGALVTMDSLSHAYTLHRLRQLGGVANSRVVEIGGGYGCLAFLAARAGLTDYEIFDLPWVGAIQGYFLIAALGAERVRLFGEEGGGVRVTPHWRFAGLANRSVDYVVNTNSLPELGEATGLAYVKGIGRVLRGRFLSINQEAGVRGQTCVPELIERAGNLTRHSRHLCWNEQGYVEEVYGPRAEGGDG